MWVVSPTQRVGRYVATIGATYEVIHPGISTSLPLHQRLRHASLRATPRGQLIPQEVQRPSDSEIGATLFPQDTARLSSLMKVGMTREESRDTLTQ